MKKMSKESRIIVLLVMLAAVIFPLFLDHGNNYIFQILGKCVIYSMCAISLNLLMGYTGQFSLGHGAFFMVGAYTFGISTVIHHVSPWLALVLAVIVCYMVGYVLGFAGCKFSAIYLAMITLGFSKVLTLVVTNEVWLTKGTNGISGIPKFSFWGYKLNTFSFYFFALACLIVMLYLYYNMVNSATGRAFKAVRGKPIAAATMGVNVNRYKLLVFAISSAMAGFAGALYASMLTYISPTSFSSVSISLIIMTIVGGCGTLFGPVIGACILTILPEFLRGAGTYIDGMYGVLALVTILFMPAGIMGGLVALRKMVAEKSPFGKAMDKGKGAAK
ncbi:MAG: branched-chain amino acid ABC transporter permease [Eubacteriales bacterium]|nr:branched-chain amino acid ABC transporter permease [Eubacteriales bacterium]